MKSKSAKLSKGKKSIKKTETDLMIEHLENQIKTDIHKIAWFSKEISQTKKEIAQNRKILKKLIKLK
ncbi:MAG: hypothetical protein A3J76_05375 [Candidatus Moranbacteria bacterium RBG_13_45_13]|nr:MAG: hypothetical protein A3J76_05375 [Candidatus Moranbacteria bacterium RBG_13_45_13]